MIRPAFLVLPGIFRSEMSSGRTIDRRIPTMGGLRRCWGFLRIHRREGKQMPCSMSVFLGRAIHVSIARANRAVSAGEVSMEGSAPHASMLRRPLIWRE